MQTQAAEAAPLPQKLVQAIGALGSFAKHHAHALLWTLRLGQED